MATTRIKQSKAYYCFKIFNILFFIGVSLIMIIPFLNVLTLSLEPAHIADQVGFHLFPKQVTLEAYHRIITQGGILNNLKNSIIVTLINAILGTLLTAMFAFTLTEKNLPGVKLLSFMVVFTMMFQGGLIPNYLLVKELGMINSLWSLILPVLMRGYNIILMKSFFESIPKSLIEAAKVDGAQDIKIFFTIILPLSKAILVTIFLFYAVLRWNAYFDAMLYITDNNLMTLQVFLRELLVSSDMAAETATDINLGKNVEMAAAIISMVPIMMIYPFLQKYFTKGIMLGAEKG